MPKQTFRVKTDKGDYDVEVDVPEEKGQSTTGFLDTTGAILKNAAKSFVPGAVKGAIGAVVGLPVAAYHAAMDAPGAAVDIASDPMGAVRKLGTNALAMGRSLAEWPSNIVEDVYKGATDPAAYGKMVGEATGEGAGAGAVGKLLPVAPKPVMRTVGKGLEYAGDHPFAARMAGGAGVVSGIYKGDPGMILAGATGMAAPALMTKAGRTLRLASGETLADLEGKMPTGSRTLDFGKIDTPAIGVEPRPAPKVGQGVPYTGQQAPITLADRIQMAVDNGEMRKGTRQFPKPTGPIGVKMQGAASEVAPGGATGAPSVPEVPPAAEAALSPVEQFYRDNPMGEGRTTGQFPEGPGGLQSVADMPTGPRPFQTPSGIMADMEESYGHGLRANRPPVAEGATTGRPGELPPPNLTIGEMPGPTGAPFAQLPMEQALANQMDAAERSMPVDPVRKGRRAEGSAKFSPNDLELLQSLMGKGMGLEEAAAEVMKARAERASGYRMNGGMDAGYQSGLDK